jgi:GGDEF domain-containing protein
MHVLIVDPEKALGPTLRPLLVEQGWTVVDVHRYGHVGARSFVEAPDLIVVHGDGQEGEAAHTCQWLKGNVLTAGVPILLVENAPPPAWLLAGLPADAIVQAPWERSEVLHHLAMLVPSPVGIGTQDDLTNLPNRKMVLDDLARRIAARELFGAGLLCLCEADACLQDFGRTGLDQFVVLVSVLLRRHATGSAPVSVGHLDHGTFLVIGPMSTVHEIVARITYEFDTLVPAYYEMDTPFGADSERESDPATWMTLQGAVCLVEPGLFDNVLQVGTRLSQALGGGLEALEAAAQEKQRAGGPVITSSIG